MGHRSRMRTLGDMLGHSFVYLLESHSSLCCLLSNLNFELLKSVMYVNSCACECAMNHVENE